MTQVWGATSTTDEVLSGIDLHRKRVLVTGVSAGIGVETARALDRASAKGRRVEWRQLRADRARSRQS
jgi:NAD(P)-dependent dehydrogenase (short-subunit alcohol dehydrogenase family)